MAKVSVTLLRPLDGQEIGSTVEYDQADADRLAGYGAVEINGKRANKAAPALETTGDNDPLDHDGDGRKGGSRRRAKASG